jgi:N utilization substance protein B
MIEFGPEPQADDDDEAPPRDKPLSARQRARRAAMQACYQWLQSDSETGDLILQFDRAGYLKGADRGYFRKTVRFCLDDTEALSPYFEPFLDRPADQLDPVEHAILIVATYELLHRLEIPYRVVLNEALDIAREFGAEDGHRFVNGVLDKVARQTRSVEVGMPRSG